MDKEDKEAERWKTIVILSGNLKGKIIFNDTIRNSGYRLWNINPYTVLGKPLTYVRCDAVKEDDYHKFLDETIGVLEKYFAFKIWYARRIIEGFIENIESKILVLNGYGFETSKRLVDEHPNVFTIDIRTAGREVSIEHDITLFIDGFNIEKFKKEVLKTIHILTKKLGD